MNNMEITTHWTSWEGTKVTGLNVRIGNFLVVISKHGYILKVGSLLMSKAFRKGRVRPC